jgi:glutamine synthetase
LERLRSYFEADGVFSPAMIDGIIKHLRSFNDRTLRHDIEDNPDAMQKLVNTYFHCG